jgi:uncharacterized protein
MSVAAGADAPAPSAMGAGAFPATPTGGDARLDSLDVLRGVAILGILLMNVVGFGLPRAYLDPTVAGGVTAAEGPDFVAWLLTFLLFEGTMRGLFTLLFGAGLVLFTSRLERAGVPDAADLHVRRMLWLVAFGFVDSHLLLWHGDILYEYGLTGLVLYAFRKSRPRTLLALAAAMLLLPAVGGYFEIQQDRAQRAAALEAQRAEADGEELDASQRRTIEAWNATLAEMRPPADELAESVEAMRGGVASAWRHVTDLAFEARTVYFYEVGFLEDLATMMIGVAMFAFGALQGRWSRRQYALLAALGYGLGLAVNGWEAALIVRSGFDPIEIQSTWSFSYPFGRVPTMLGHVGLVLWLWKAGAWPALMRRLAAVGRMAFTNYLTQSLIGALVFTGAGLGLFGQLARHELYYVVAATWVLQLAWSPWWLARHRHGPAEWLWRSLTYRAWQPLRRTTPD